MGLENIKKLARGDDEERVGISLKVPASTKVRLEEFAKENGFSVNALINAMILNGFEDVPLEKELYLELNELEKKLSGFLLREEDGGEEFHGMYCNPGAIDNFPDELANIISRVQALRKFLK
jgi:hypothetical protein